MLEERDAIQRDLDRLQEQAHVNLMRPSARSCTWDGTTPVINAVLQSRTWGYWWMKYHI